MGEGRRRRRNPWSLVLLILLFCCGIAFALSRMGVKLLQRESFGATQTIDIVNLQRVEALPDGFVYYDGSVAACIDLAGDVRWSYMLGASADIHATSYGTAAWSGDLLTLIESDGVTSYTGNMEDSILSASMDRRYTAVLLGEETGGKLVLLDKDGRKVSQIALDDVSAMRYGFFSDGSLLWVMVMDTNGTTPSCTIQTYRPGKEIVGSIKDAEQLCYSVLFQSSQVLVAGDTYLKTFDYTGTENRARRRLIYGWKLEDFDPYALDPLMVLVNDAQCKQENDMRDVRVLRSNLDRVMRFPYGCNELRAVGDTLYGFSADGRVMIYPVDADSASVYQLGTRIDRVYGVTQSGIAILGEGNRVHMVSLV